MTQVKDDKYFNALFRFDSLNRQMFSTFKEPLKLSLVFISNKRLVRLLIRAIVYLWLCSVFHNFLENGLDRRVIIV